MALSGAICLTDCLAAAEGCPTALEERSQGGANQLCPSCALSSPAALAASAPVADGHQITATRCGLARVTARGLGKVTADHTCTGNYLVNPAYILYTHTCTCIHLQAYIYIYVCTHMKTIYCFKLCISTF